MDATLIDPSENPSPGRGGRAARDGELLSLRPPPGRWDAALARSTAALDAALRATLSADRGAAPLTRWQRTAAAGAAAAGIAGVAGLAALAVLKPELGPCEPAAVLAAVGAAGLPAALCVRRAILGVERRSAASEAPRPGPAPVRQASLLRRLVGRLTGGSREHDRAARRRERRRDRAVARTLDDIALRERRLAERVAAEERRPLSAAPAAPAPARGSAPGTGRGMRREPDEAPWTLPREVADALADLEARERLHARRQAERGRAERTASPARPPAQPASGRSAPAEPPRSRRHERIKPRNTRTQITTAEGRKIGAVILDVSQSGVAIEGDLPGLWIGSMVTVGSRRAKAVRVLPRGMAFEFSTPVAAEALTADLVL